MAPCVDVPRYRTFARDGSSAIALTPLFALRSGSTFFHVRPWLALAKRPLEPPAGLILGACFDDEAGEDVLVTPEDVLFRLDTNPHPMQGGAGQVNPAVALATLARNKWIAVERADGRFRIGLGERLRTTSSS